MDFDKYYEEYLPVFKKYWLPIALFLFGLILLVSGLISSLNSKSEEIIFKPAEDVKSAVTKRKIVIDVSGEVIKPGVYSLEEGSRIQDALILASGLSQNADRDWVSKNLNLAQKLVDGTKIYIPKQGEQIQASSQGTISTSGLININSASSSELDTLPGIGPVTAQKIIDNRPYSSVDELLSKKAVTQKVFDNLKDSISVY